MSRELQTSRLGLVSAGAAKVSILSRSRAFTSRAHPCIWAFDWYKNRRPWMTLNGVMAVTLRYFTEFGVSTHNRVDLWWLCTSLLYFVLRVWCRRKESSRSLSHMRMSFLSYWFCMGLTTMQRYCAACELRCNKCPSSTSVTHWTKSLQFVSERVQRYVRCVQFSKKSVPHPSSFDSEAAVAV